MGQFPPQTFQKLVQVLAKAPQTLKGLQQKHFEEVLARAGSRAEAARMLGISKTTLWRKCKELGLE